MRASALLLPLTLWACSPEELQRWEPAGAVPVRELSHTVAVQFTDGAAHLEVKRRFRNDGVGWESLNRDVALPKGAVVTGFRVGPAGEFGVPATLGLREEIDARWDLLSAPGLAEPSTLGRLEWSDSSTVHLELFALAPGATVDVAWEVDLPVDYEAGALAFSYPLEEVTPGFLAPTFAPGLIDLATTGDDGSIEVRRAWMTRDLVDARWATFPLDTERELWRLELDAAPEFDQVPVRPKVVFAIDASHSEGAEGIAAQLELVAPYLANVPDAQVEVVLYRRFAERLFGQLVPAADVAARLALLPRERLAPGNGSHLERGAALAAEVLAQAGGPGRLVLLTDERLRHGFTNELALDALARLPRDAVVHVVERSASGGTQLTERRDDGAGLSAVAEAHGGIFTRVDGAAADPLLSAATMLGLVRPVRLDSFAVEAPGLEEVLVVDSELREGVGVRLGAVSARPPREVVVTGKLWAKDFRRVVRLDAALVERLPAFAVADESLDLTDDEERTVAFVAHAVSPWTSYLWAPPGAAPSVVGVERFGGGAQSFSLCGCGGSSSHCGFGFATTAPDTEALVRALLAPGLAACEAQHGSVSGATLQLEATADEVVDVGVAAPSDGLRDCLVEVGWGLRLDERFTRHTSWALQL